MTVEYRDETPMAGDATSNNIADIAKAIRSKKYGGDTREAMAQSLEKMGELAMNAAEPNNNLAKQAYDTAIGYQKMLADKIAKMDNGVHAYATVDDIKKAYPNGKDGIFVAVDTGHQWYYVNGKWQDGGSYQSPKLNEQINLYPKGYMKQNLFEDSEFFENNEWIAYGDGSSFEITGEHLGHKILKNTNTSGKGGIYSTAKPFVQGTTISLSVLASFVPVDNNSYAKMCIRFLSNDGDFGKRTVIKEVEAFYIEDEEWTNLKRNGIVAPAGTKFVDFTITFVGAGIIFLTMPLATASDYVGFYNFSDYRKELTSFPTRNNLTENHKFVDNINFWEAKNNATISLDKSLFNGNGVMKISNHDTTLKPFVVSKKMKVVPNSTISFFNTLYFTSENPTDNVVVQIAFHTKDEPQFDKQISSKSKKLTTFDRWINFSVNNIKIPENVVFVRIKYILNNSGDLYVSRPLLVNDTHTLIYDINDLAKANPLEIKIENPYYSTSSRGYVWFKFDKIKVNLYSDTQEITWTDYMKNENTFSDDSYVEGVYSCNVGPAYSDNSYKLVYSITSNSVLVSKEESPFLITLLAYNPDTGYYGLLKEQYDAALDQRRGSTFVHLNTLTTDMIEKLDKKADELYPMIADNDKFVFGLMTDNHQTGFEQNQWRPNYTGMAYERIRQALQPDANLNLGDSSLTAGDSLVALRRAFEYTPVNEWVYCEGNHDRWIKDPILPPEQFYVAVNRVHRNDSRFHYGDGNQGAYFYVNYDDKKLRVVVIDDYDVGSKHDDTYNDNAGIRQKQFTWLATDALQVPEDWHVLVMVHQSPMEGMRENNRVVNSNQLMQLFSAFKSGVNTTITARDTVFEDGTFDVDLTTTFTHPGKLIAVLSGHNHVDDAKVKDGVNYITSECGYIDIQLYQNKNDQAPKYGQRTQHDYSAISFDFGVIDFKEQTLRLKRFGHGKDRVFTW